MTFPLQLAWIGFIATVLSYLSVIPLRHWTERRRILDIPNERSSHAKPIPRGGGLAIVFVSLVGLSTMWLINPSWSLRELSIYLFGAALIAFVSWLDDLKPLPNRIRFATHSVGTLLAVLGLGYWRGIDVPILGHLHLGWPGLLITFLWVVGLTNAYNFMDGIDGIAGGQAAVAGVGWVVLGCLSDQPQVAVLSLLLAAASIGFLGHNWPPARIFMGDVGSAFLGYSFAVLSVISAQNDSRFALIGMLLVWPFVFDTSFTFFRRLRNHENVFTAHRSHLYQRMVISGYSHRFVTLLYIGLAFIGFLFSLGVYLGTKETSEVLLLSLPLLCFGLWFFVIWRERRIFCK